jgi:hypothetical protein
MNSIPHLAVSNYMNTHILEEDSCSPSLRRGQQGYLLSKVLCQGSVSQRHVDTIPSPLATLRLPVILIFDKNKNLLSSKVKYARQNRSIMLVSSHLAPFHHLRFLSSFQYNRYYVLCSISPPPPIGLFKDSYPTELRLKVIRRSVCLGSL